MTKQPDKHPPAPLPCTLAGTGSLSGSLGGLDLPRLLAEARLGLGSMVADLERLRWVGHCRRLRAVGGATQPLPAHREWQVYSRLLRHLLVHDKTRRPSFETRALPVPGPTPTHACARSFNFQRVFTFL